MNNLSADRRRIEDRLLSIFDHSNTLDKAMSYAVLNGGKRIRAHLIYESTRIFDGDLTLADYGAEAIECMHAYSLVHDDLPSMDDDDMRRGQPTVHRKWNEATAILVGGCLTSPKL